jgi:hypothetical protein
MAYKQKPWSGWSPLKQKETFGEKARRARSIRPIKGEYFEGQPEGSESTHLMSTYESDGKYYAAPTITNKTKSGKYKSQSFDEAINAGELFEFDTPEEADAFAKGNWKLKLASDLHKDIKNK